ncbi:hypothetical protein [Nocardioides sp. T2.26MG-1]|uniref:hypothetical protein n=1 Tax=Nocardioides sp. T2.26MG-1 TaxID=3041166 RepID=UPI002477CBBA|nr:hypothetical protein [Nocardioides sp. T2.26MG-1]CAI9405344.1 hypothetical protein HIDPHFAB_04363 [Nocardioides sp. T2.26MG-1]
MTEPDSKAVVQRFHATNGRVSGYVGLAAAAVVLVLALRSWDGEHGPVIAISALLGAVLVWMALLRPALWVTTDHLVMRSMFHTDHVPLGAITKVVVGQVLAVQAAGKRYASPVVAYTARQVLRSKAARDKRPATAADTYQVFVEERILHLAAEHRELHGDVEEPVRRTWAWPEIVATVVLVVALVVAIVL